MSSTNEIEIEYLNRYGEKVEEVELLEDWNCLKCRGNCNCSFCRKKQGLKPTGLVHTAKEGGFGSVSEMLTARRRENFGIERKVADREAVNGNENSVDRKMKAPRPRLCPPCSPRPLPSGSSTSIVALSSILGAGTFVKTQYIPRLAEISNLVNIKAIWSRSEESARGAVEIAGKHFPGVECKWGDKGLEKLTADSSILGVAVVLAGQAQL